MLFGLWSSCAAAGIYWLPDYLKDNIDTNHRTDTDTGGGDIPLGCEKYSPQCSSPHILGGIEIRVAGDLFCPMECICPDSFRYTTANCSGDKKPAGSACDGKYNDCRALTCEEKGQKTCNGSCIAKSACCTDSDCGSDQKCSSGSCVAQTCEDKGQKTCNGSCIAKSACCTDSDCGSDQKCSSGSCVAQTCEDKGQKTCNGSCIAKSACCTDSDCGTNQKCSSGNCVAKTCEEMGQKTCNGKCIGSTACCVSGDCPSGKKCFDNVCIAQTCEDKGLKTCNGSCIANSECCGGCGAGEECQNGTCVNAVPCVSPYNLNTTSCKSPYKLVKQSTNTACGYCENQCSGYQEASLVQCPDINYINNIMGSYANEPGLWKSMGAPDFGTVESCSYDSSYKKCILNCSRITEFTKGNFSGQINSSCGMWGSILQTKCTASDLSNLPELLQRCENGTGGKHNKGDYLLYQDLQTEFDTEKECTIPTPIPYKDCKGIGYLSCQNFE